MKLANVAPSRKKSSTTQSCDEAVNPTRDDSTSPSRTGARLDSRTAPSIVTHDLGNGKPSRSPSTVSIQTSSTTTPRSRIQRSHSRPKWLDVDVNGGLLKRKTDPAVAAVTIKGADSISRQRRDDAPDTIGSRDAGAKGKGKPRFRKATTLDTISTPRCPEALSSRRRVSESLLSGTSGVTAQGPLRDDLEDVKKGFVGSPEQEEAPESSAQTQGNTERQVESTTRSDNAEQTGAVTVPGGVEGNVPIAADLNSGTEAQKTAIPGPAPTDEQPEASQLSNTDTAQGSVAPEVPPPPQESRLMTWGAWAYSYVPAVRRFPDGSAPTSVTSALSIEPGPSPPPPDFERHAEDTGINEAIGAVPSSDAKEEIYNTDSADSGHGTETEQGIGVDPLHRSEVPASRVGRSVENAGTWSLTGLASNALKWRRASDIVSAGMQDVKDGQKTIEERLGKVDLSGEASTAGGPRNAEQPLAASGNAGDTDNSAASTEPARCPAPITPGNSNDATWSGYVSSWIRTPTTSLDPKSGSGDEAAAGRSGESVTTPAQTIANSEAPDLTTALIPTSENKSPETTATVPEPSTASTTEPIDINAMKDAYLQQQKTDPGQTSRTAWALTVASKWIPRTRSNLGTVEQLEQGRKTTSDLPHIDRVISRSEERQPSLVQNTATNSEQNPTPTASLTAPQALMLTPEALEERQSPLLPTTTSMVAASRPNLVLPSFNHTFRRPPRASPEQSSRALWSPEHEEASKWEKIMQASAARPRSPPNMAWRALGAVSHYARGASKDNSTSAHSIPKETPPAIGIERSKLPALVASQKDRWNGVRRVVIIGVHGWFPNAHVQKVMGAPRGSSYFASMMGQAVLAQFEADFGVGQEAPEKVTYIPLDGEGTVEVRVEKLFKAYLSRADWVTDVRRADAIFVAAHSQGTIVAAHLIARLIGQGHIRTAYNGEAVGRCEWAFGSVAQPGHSRQETSLTSPLRASKLPKVGLLAMCGVHQGPFYSSTTSTVLQPYLTWFESVAARELFEFQDSQSVVVAEYRKSLSMILHHGVKTIFLASLDDQIVPIYSATFAAASHPLILRLLYVDAAIHSSTDFMINLIVFCLMLRNAGLDDQGLVGHLSEATAGAWRGAGHSTPYEDPGAYAFMVKYLLSTDSPDADALPELHVEDFAVRDAKNDYELPWILRGVMDDPDVKLLFDAEITELKENILSWNPTTRALKEIKKRLEPMAGRAALRQHQQKERLQRSSSFLSLASSEGQVSARKQDGALSSSPRTEPLREKALSVASSTVMNADW